MLVGAQAAAHGRNMDPSLVRKGRLTHIGQIFIRGQIGDLSHIMREVKQGCNLACFQAWVAQFDLQIRDDRTKVGIAATFSIAVDRSLDLGAASLNCCQRISNSTFAVVVCMDAQRNIQRAMDRFYNFTDLIGQCSPIGIT